MLVVVLAALGQEISVFAVFLFGVGLRRAGLLASADGAALVRVVFCAGLPALVIQSFAAVRLESSLLLLFVFSPVVVGVSLAVVLVRSMAHLRATDRSASIGRSAT